jgi:hypothetical protein
MKRIVIAIAGALAIASGAAGATEEKSPSPKDQSRGASADSTMSGDVKTADPATMIITILLPSGDEQQLNVANDARITRDGDTASLGQLQQGDNVRASYDPGTHKASKLDVKSKGGSKSKDNPKSKDQQKSQDNSQQK